MFLWHQPIRKSTDILTGFLRDDICLRTIVQQRAVRPPEIINHMVKSKYMGPAETVIDRKSPVPVIIIRTDILVRLFPGHPERTHFSPPVKLIGRSIDIMSYILIVIGRQNHIQPFSKQIPLTVFQRWHQRITFTVFPAEYNFLPLYIFDQVNPNTKRSAQILPATPIFPATASL